MKKNKERQKALIPLMIYIITYVAFLFCLVFQKAILLYFLGIMLLTELFVEFLLPLLSKNSISKLSWVSMVVSFISFVIILSIYIATIPFDNYRTVITALAASSLGGLLTLTGVGLTVKYTRIYKEEDDIERLKPHIYVIGDTFWAHLPQEKKSQTFAYITQENEKEVLEAEDSTTYELVFMRIANSDLSLSVIRGLFIDDEFIRFKYEIALPKGSYTQILFYKSNFTRKNKLSDLSLLVEDIKENEYRVKLGFEEREHKDKTEIRIMSTFNPVPII